MSGEQNRRVTQNAGNSLLCSTSLGAARYLASLAPPTTLQQFSLPSPWDKQNHSGTLPKQLQGVDPSRQTSSVNLVACFSVVTGYLSITSDLLMSSSSCLLPSLASESRHSCSFSNFTSTVPATCHCLTLHLPLSISSDLPFFFLFRFIQGRLDGSAG